ncbi:MAG TPA: glycosyltransferase family 39 protein, partial [Tepidisphaeraceae bacterium]
MNLYNAWTMTAVAPAVEPSIARPAWDLRWLTPARCRWILVLVLALDVVGHVNYLHHCPADLSGDEAQYWDWSRNLDWSYYSKGPLIAYIIRGSCAIFGETMPAVRYPAIAFGVATSIVTYLLTRKLFGSERLALGAVLLNHLVPMFIAGSILMTIDPPMFLCWALATLFAAYAIFDGRKGAWLLVGVAIGVGFLAKYATPLWYLGTLGFLIATNQLKRQGAGLVAAAVVTLLFTAPVIVWNAQHGWVSLHHVAHQTGASGGSLKRGNLFELVGSQIGVIGPILSALMIAAVAQALRKTGDRAVEREKLLFLVWIGLTFLALTIV